ncbi:pirin family protein [Nocardioides sp.]|uniref:pirin family protein n=1 Tax=Nocardioides sp. TaxID=35761 RepID=UPI00261DC63D|nr:pirin family protein [Nocardioides sp.]
MTVQIRRASARFIDKVPGRATWHSFSFGSFYDPERVAFGPMVCHDEHLLGAGQGFAEHHHEGVDIVTYVVTGALSHRDSLGNEGVLQAGELGWLRASSGVEHSEVAAAPATRFVQVWLQQYDGTPAWQRVAIEPSNDAPNALRPPTLALPGGELRVLRLAAGEHAMLPTAPLLHLFVASGALLRHSLAEPLSAGDTLMVTAEETPAQTPGLEIAAATEAVVLVWTMTA